MGVGITIEHPGPVHADLLRRRAERLLAASAYADHDMGLLLTGDDAIRRLNGAYRGKDRATNVLSFAMLEGDRTVDSGLLGDIVISVDTARREAEKSGVSLHHRLTQLLIHGFLHLIGMDHERSDEEYDRMLAEENRQFARLLQEERRENMVQLAINVDHVATLRQARGTVQPDPVFAASICELAGAAGIVVHLREDRRHIQDRDVRLLRQTVKTRLNLEMGASEEIIAVALDVVPDMVTLVPEKRQELTTEGGLNVAGQRKKLKEVVARFTAAGIPVSMFIDPVAKQIEASREVGATFVEIHTGRYCDAGDERERDEEFELIARAAEAASEQGLRVNAGHGLDYCNTGRVAALPFIDELSIGHAVMARAILVGLDAAVREMLAICRGARR
ncbi:MAG: pyridoxine 5'-phosphate synthase [Thermodesulfobacteriota bacterium]